MGNRKTGEQAPGKGPGEAAKKAPPAPTVLDDDKLEGASGALYQTYLRRAANSGG